MITLGIDLGSFHSRIAAIINDTVSVIEIYDERKLSSTVSLKSGTLLNGIKARNTASGNMILDACRLQHERIYSKTWCFAKTYHGKCIVQTKSSAPTIIPQQNAIAALLRTLIDAAEKRLGTVVDKIVITVPDYIDHYFRSLIIDATKLAKINDVQLITQNTAAAITYVRSKPRTSSSTCFMIFNFGANQLSISVFENYEKNTKLIFANSDETIGGEDFTVRLTEVFLEILKQQEGNNNFIPGTKTLKYLRETAEKAKIDFSLMDQTECELEIVEENRCHSVHFTRADFEKFCWPLLEKVENCIKSVAQNLKQNISEIIMVGGASRIFAVKQFLKSQFPNASFNSTLVPEETIVCGAAIKAEMLNKSLNAGVGDIRNTSSSSIYSETEFAKIQLIKSMEIIPNTPRCFSYVKDIPKIEFFESGQKLQSLGYIENVPANSYFCCEFDNNGLLKCFIHDKLVDLKREKEVAEMDVISKTSSDETKQLPASSETQKNVDKESSSVTNTLEQTSPLLIQSKQDQSTFEILSLKADNIPIKSEALIKSYGSSTAHAAAPPIPTHYANSAVARSNTLDYTKTSTVTNKTSPYHSLSSSIGGTTTFTNDKPKPLINQQSSPEVIQPHNFVDTHAGYGRSNASYNRHAPSDRDTNWVKVNSSHINVEPQRSSSSSSNSTSNYPKVNDRYTTTSTTSRNSSTYNYSDPTKEKEKTFGKFPSETHHL